MKNEFERNGFWLIHCLKNHRQCRRRDRESKSHAGAYKA